MTNLIADARDQHRITVRELNVGDGFGIRYTDDDMPARYETYLESASRVIHKVCTERGIDTPYLYLEPGRSIVGNAGITLYTVGAIKEIPGMRTYLSVDGGITDNPRYALYKARYDMTIANKVSDWKTHIYTVAGRCCENGDLLGEGISLQQASTDDILAVLATGAYNYSMASNYNRLPHPAVIFVNDGKARVVVRRQSLEDLVRGDE